MSEPVVVTPGAMPSSYHWRIRTSTTELSDAELLVQARMGSSDAYAQLYQRHNAAAIAAARALTRSRSDADDVVAEAFTRVLRALHTGGGPEVSFRPYLLTAVRNVFYDHVRRRREESDGDISDSVNLALLHAADADDDRGMASAAFATLPERWQLVLWHTEVEDESMSEVAALLGVAPNAVAALAYRAREGLRQAFLQAHLRRPRSADCEACLGNLGAYVRDGLSARDRRKVEEHLDHCDDCPPLLVEVTNTNTTLRAALLPALVGVAAPQPITPPASVPSATLPVPVPVESAPVSTPPKTSPLAPPVPATAPATAAATSDPATVPAATVPVTVVAVPPSFSATAAQLSTSVVGGSVRVRVDVANTGGSAAANVRRGVALPAGVNFVSSQSPLASTAVYSGRVVSQRAAAFLCAGQVTCTLPLLGVGQTATVVMVVRVATSAVLPAQVITPTVTSDAGGSTTVTPAQVITTTLAGAPVLAAETVRGSVVAIGNAVVTCADASPDCAAAPDQGAVQAADPTVRATVQFSGPGGGRWWPTLLSTSARPRWASVSQSPMSLHWSVAAAPMQSVTFSRHWVRPRSADGRWS